jgi:hypothetical protein
VDVRLAAIVAAAAVAATPIAYLQGRQGPSGGFAEPRGEPSPQLTAWAVLGLRAAGAKPSAAALGYLVAHEDELPDVTDAELVAMAESVLGRRPERLLTRIEEARRNDGRIGPNVNSTIWGVLALRQAGEPLPRATLRFILRRQARSGGWSWFAGGAPDSNDTAAAVEALRSAGLSAIFACSRTGTEASSSFPTAARTASRRPGRSRRSSPREHAFPRRRKSTCDTCAAGTGASATRRATPRRRSG